MKTTRRVNVRTKKRKTDDKENMPGFNSKVLSSYFNKSKKR